MKNTIHREIASADYPGIYKLHSSADLDPLMERIGEARVVLLGEASHGTHDFYTWRTALSRRLIKEKGFSFIAVEGDWPDCYQINRYIKHYPGTAFQAADVLSKFRRWPTWMWANWEIAALMEWLREYNNLLASDERIGFYGLDVYSLWESMETIIHYLKKEDPPTAEMAMEALNCFEPYEERGGIYSRGLGLTSGCRDQVIRLLLEVQRKSSVYDHDREAGLNTEINALVIANGEKYYRSMVSFNDESWNIRDRHMLDTLKKIMTFHGPQAKAIVWEHNTHIGDARATDMKDENLLNVGQLAREFYGNDDVVLVGAGTYEGSVIAGRIWAGKMQHMEVPPAQKGSIEHYLHSMSPENKLIIFNDKNRDVFGDWFNHRAIGVVYRPEFEKGNYVPSQMNARYDAFMFLNKTRGLHPLHIKPDGHLIPDTYPFAF